MDALKDRDPARIGAYTLLARLGAGGMGQVHLARSPGGRLVAIKVIRDEITDHPEALARFRREVETVRAVRSAYTANLDTGKPNKSPNLGVGYTSKPQDIFTHWKDGGFVHLVYPDDFQGNSADGDTYEAIPLTGDPGDWTVVFYHVNGSPTDCESIGCHGFHVGSS